jgi:ATP-binding cassette, subfamily B, bacterial HlyB/CyaB
MTLQSHLPIPELLKTLHPFQSLSDKRIEEIAAQCNLAQYQIGQSILVRNTPPEHLVMIYQGQARTLGYDVRTRTSVSLEIVGPGAILGGVSLLRDSGCETVLASTNVIAFTLSASNFWQLMATEPQFATALRAETNLCEVFELLGFELQQRADAKTDLRALAQQVWQETLVLSFPKGTVRAESFDANRLWLVSAGTLGTSSVGGRVAVHHPRYTWQVKYHQGVRLLGFPTGVYLPISLLKHKPSFDLKSPELAVLENPIEHPTQPEPSLSEFPQKSYPMVRGQGNLDAVLASLRMLTKTLAIPFRKELVRSALQHQLKTSGQLSLQSAGAIAEMLGMRAQVVQIGASDLARLKFPALIQWRSHFAVLYEVNGQGCLVADPESDLRQYSLREFIAIWGNSGQVLQVEVRDRAEKFGLRWFLPALRKYKHVLVEVLVASGIIQIFGLANPLITQVIIDKVLVQRSLDTLDILGIFLIGVAIFEALLTSLRTYLFTDTTNRLDLSLGTEVVRHLLKLPLNFFERRQVGDLAGRIHELENIRQFLTGTALTVVLDAVFSIIYIAVMVMYSWQLTLVSLATVPLFGLLTLIVSPIARYQSQQKAEHYGTLHAYLVELLTGIQTVKAQNVELQSRWQWQDHYTRYIRSGFRTTMTFSHASTVSGFLNKLTGLLLLWVGAHLVLADQLTLGGLIAFRILSGYVISPLLRLIQLWQNFQETALSMERLGDILQAVPESDEQNPYQILLPEMQGAVTYKNVSFRFHENAPLQLQNINLEIPVGSFVGIVGQSGSGKSTLTKLLHRLYEPSTGQIQIDGYDISKVELSSLRQQIGMVLQDTMLFNGTIQDNIKLTRPEASSEEVIAAAKIAFAHDFIMALPNGYNTPVGERGAALSGGQRQRVAIARMVLQKPKLLILDEATSALDYDTEFRVCQNLASAFREHTVLFITHRLNTVQQAARILVMDQGSIVESGNHAELMALRGRYYCLYQQ